jgi:hypothetical protein
VTVAVVPERGGPRGDAPLRLATVVTDPAAAMPAALQFTGLKLQQVLQAVTNPPAPAPAVTEQTLQLTDTRCDRPAREAATDHAVRETALAGASCAAGAAGRPSLMTAAAIPGSAGDPVRDFATDVRRAAAGGSILMRDDRSGACTDESALEYTPGEASRRRYSLHAWATAPAAAPFETAASGGRAVVSLWTRTATGTPAPARLCVALRRMSDMRVIAHSDYRLTSWPAEATQLTFAFDLDRTRAPAGERLQLVLRVPSDSGADLQLLYDHPAHQSYLTLTTVPGRELR